MARERQDPIFTNLQLQSQKVVHHDGHEDASACYNPVKRHTITIHESGWIDSFA
jgi:hypothetical protein